VRELREYMWAHLSSVLIGTSANQTFNMYLGAGQNGKSVLINLMETILGQYKGDVPLTLITQQRAKVGGLTPELVALKGVRYAVMQEPSKGDKINEGIMKQITSGIDPIQCRAPYMINTLTYIPQFKLVVCTNQLMEIKSNDHGTWRRIRVCDFMSLFTEKPTADDPDKPYQYKIDKHIIEKFKYWKEVFMAMLVEKAFQTGGVVEDCAIVMTSSNNYRNSQDYLAEYVAERIVKREGGRLQKTELGEDFRVWYSTTYGKNVPNVRELHDYIDKHLCKYNKQIQSWLNIRINYEHNSVSGGDDGETEIEEEADEDYGLSS
jgi:P4 family phage/plasmid primase-like protien